MTSIEWLLKFFLNFFLNFLLIFPSSENIKRCCIIWTIPNINIPAKEAHLMCLSEIVKSSRMYCSKSADASVNGKRSENASSCVCICLEISVSSPGSNDKLHPLSITSAKANSINNFFIVVIYCSLNRCSGSGKRRKMEEGKIFLFIFPLYAKLKVLLMAWWMEEEKPEKRLHVDSVFIRLGF